MSEQLFSQRPYIDFKLNLIDKSWKPFFQEEVQKEYFLELFNKLEAEYTNGNCCPTKENIFRLFQKIALSEIKVMILGQDPYHQPKIADGIAFSTKEPEYLPATLKNIFLELTNDLGCQMPNDANLLPWVKEGVFLLNTALTVLTGKPLSHMEIWNQFTISLLNYIKKNHKGKLVWVFWGQKAQMLGNLCQIEPSLRVESSHPSPFSAKYGFFGSRPFSKVNSLLIESGQKAIDWLTILKPKI